MINNIAIMVHSLNSGGAERIAGLLSKELSRHYNVYVFLIDTENIIYEYGGEIVNIGYSGSFYEYDISINKKKYNIDCAISFLEEMNFANIRTRGTERVLISERSVQSLIEPPFTAETLKMKRYYKYADAIIACSDGVKYDLMHNYNIFGNITTIYNFIDKESIFLKACEELPKEAQSFLGGAEFFVNVGRLHQQKNQKRLILQFSYFHKWNSNVKLLILGSGKMEDELASYILELGLRDSVKIISYTENPFAYIAKAKALILSSRYEGLPNVILEAMTLGCPILAVDCLAGPRELLMDEMDYTKPLDKLEICKRGILICNDDTEDDGTTKYMALAMQMLFQSEDLAEKLVSKEQEYMDSYTNQQILGKWIEVIEGCDRKEKTKSLEEEERFLSEAKHIVIYGAGFVGRSMYLRMSVQHKIDCFVVTNRKKGERECLGIPVKEITELEYPSEETAVIIGVGQVYQSDVVNVLKKYGYYRIVFPYIIPYSYTYYKNFSDFDMKSELREWYRLCTGKEINLDSPRTFNEKIQWLKIYDNQPIKSILADKYAVRKWVAEKIGDKYLIPLLGVWNSYEEIDFSLLPNNFVLKCTHGSGMNIIVNDKSQLNHSEVKRKINQWMSVNYAYRSGFEMHYFDIVPKIIVEKYLESENGEDLRDYKVFVFNGKVKLIQVDIDRHHIHKRNLYTPEWEYVDCSILYPSAPNMIIEEPACLKEMIALAEILGEKFIHVRVDFYIWKGQIYFGEMTFTHGSGTEEFKPEEYELVMGDWMELQKGE